MIGVSFTDDEAYAYDLDDILGYSCLIGIAHKETPEGKKVEIKSFSQLPEGMVCPPSINTPKILSYEKFDKDYFLTLPNWMKEEMEKTPEFIKMNGGVVKDEMNMETESIDPDAIPF